MSSVLYTHIQDTNHRFYDNVSLADTVRKSFFDLCIQLGFTPTITDDVDVGSGSLTTNIHGVKDNNNQDNYLHLSCLATKPGSVKNHSRIASAPLDKVNKMLYAIGEGHSYYEAIRNFVLKTIVPFQNTVAFETEYEPTDKYFSIRMITTGTARQSYNIEFSI